MENQINIGDQNAQQIGQDPVNQASQIQEKPKVNYWMISSIVLLFLFLGLGVFLFINKNQAAPTVPNDFSNNQAKFTPAPTDSTTKNLTGGLSIWPTVNMSNSVVFIGTKYHLNIGTPDGQNIQPFHQEIAQNYKYINIPINPAESPDHNKLLFAPSGETPKDNDQFNYYLASLDGKILKRLDIEKIKNTFGNQYEVRVWGWSVDGKKLVFWLRDVKNFLDDRCCEGGDYRTSKQIAIEYDLETFETKELFSKTASPLGFLFYDPAKNILVYTDSQFGGGKAHFRNLATNIETEFDNPTLINWEGTGEFFVTTDTSMRTLRIFSIYDPTREFARIDLDEPSDKRYTNWLIWSPNNKYFAIRVLNEANTYSDLLKIYDKSGKLVLNKNFELNDAVFSNDEKYLLSSRTTRDSDGIYKSTWTAIEVTTGNNYINAVTSPDLGKPIFWFK